MGVVRAVVEADYVTREEQLRELARLGCSLRGAVATLDLFDALRATLVRRLPLELELVELEIEVGKREE